MPSPIDLLARVASLAAEVSNELAHPDRIAGLPRELWQRVRADAFGAEPAGYRLWRITNSPHFVDGAFRNPVPTRRITHQHSPMVVARAQLSGDQRRRNPAAAVPVHRLLPRELALPPESGLRATWLGHATVLAEIDGRRVLFDPVWGDRCSPFRGIGPKRLHPVPIPLRELGPVDVVVISHDHYDHLDMPTIKAMVRSHTVFVVPLGVGAHLEHWGVPPQRVVELDWWRSAEIDGLHFTATPARHYCSRGPRTSRHFLWASWVVTGSTHRLFHSGDSGYYPGFAEIGRRFGPFDLTMMQTGAYSDFWPEVHMTPEESVCAHLDLRGRVMLPVHWCTFVLAQHAWDEPAERTVSAAQSHGVTLAMPRPGKPFEPAAPPGLKLWWRAVATVPDDSGLRVPDGLELPPTAPAGPAGPGIPV